MRKVSCLIIAIVAIMILCFSFLFSQETKSTPGAEAGKKAGTAKKSKRAGASQKGAVTAQGCIGKGTEANCFTLTTSDGKVYSFQNPEARKHNGHHVKITGKSTDTNSCMQGTPVAEVKIQHIAAKCPF